MREIRHWSLVARRVGMPAPARPPGPFRPRRAVCIRRPESTPSARSLLRESRAPGRRARTQAPTSPPVAVSEVWTLRRGAPGGRMSCARRAPFDFAGAETSLGLRVDVFHLVDGDTAEIIPPSVAYICEYVRDLLVLKILRRHHIIEWL